MTFQIPLDEGCCIGFRLVLKIGQKKLRGDFFYEQLLRKTKESFKHLINYAIRCSRIIHTIDISIN